MNDIQTLAKTIALWDWLARYPTRSKYDAYSMLPLTGDMNLCPLCENVRIIERYAAEIIEEKPDCKRCLLRDFWPDQDCCGTDSDFTKWRYAKTEKERTYHAQKISFAAQLKLQSITKETKRNPI